MAEKSKLDLILELPEPIRKEFIDSMSDEQLVDFLYDWDIHARPKQMIPPGDWSGWLVLAGRGFGKSRTGSETVRRFVEQGTYGKIALVNATVEDAHKVFVDGLSGILETSHPKMRPRFHTKGRKFTWDNGAVAYVYTAEEPEAFRGPEHDFIWFDELFKYRYQQEVFDQAMFGLRVGDNPRWMATTTPKPTELAKQLVNKDDIILTSGSTYENTKLAQNVRDYLEEKYGGTRLGRQELYAELLEDNPNALFNQDDIDKDRITTAQLPKLTKIVIGLDPAGTSNSSSDDTGIIVVGLGSDGHGYVLEDGTCHERPAGWASTTNKLYHKYQANEIVAETNYGGDMVIHTIKNDDSSVFITKVTATKGKALRAEPVSVLYEQNKVHHVGNFPELEGEMCSFDPSSKVKQRSPNRLDALVWALTRLFNLAKPEPGIC